jgi:translation initiation factor IF-1
MNERFLLDARIKSVITNRAFRAVLGNGHEFVAFLGAGAEGEPTVPGAIVKVEMSPCDMSKGRIAGSDSEGCDESA